MTLEPSIGILEIEPQIGVFGCVAVQVLSEAFVATVEILVPAVEIFVATSPSQDLGAQGADALVHGLANLAAQLADPGTKRLIVRLETSVLVP